MKRNIAFMTSDLKSGGSERVASRLTKLFSDKYNIYYIVYDDSDISYEIDAELINLDAVASDNKIKKVFNLINEAYAPLYGTVHLSDKQIKKYANKFNKTNYGKLDNICIKSCKTNI